MLVTFQRIWISAYDAANDGLRQWFQAVVDVLARLIQFAGAGFVASVYVRHVEGGQFRGQLVPLGIIQLVPESQQVVLTVLAEPLAKFFRIHDCLNAIHCLQQQQ